MYAGGTEEEAAAVAVPVATLLYKLRLTMAGSDAGPVRPLRHFAMIQFCAVWTGSASSSGIECIPDRDILID